MADASLSKMPNILHLFVIKATEYGPIILASFVFECMGGLNSAQRSNDLWLSDRKIKFMVKLTTFEKDVF